MEPSKRSNLGWYALVLVVVIVVIIFIVTLIGPRVGQTFSTINNCLGCQATPTLAPVGISPGDELAQIDQLLQQTRNSSFAYNKPDNMQLGQTVTVQLLLNPSVSPEQLATQVTASGAVASGSIDITPRMKAELKAQDDDALLVKPLHDNAEQLVSGQDTTQWEWFVTARKEGEQHLTLVIYRLVRYDGQDFWRTVKTYEADINITVTLAQRIQSLDWGWVAGILATAILVPAFWRWIDSRKEKKADTPEKPRSRAKK